jgi:hypothetical protein
VGGLPALVGVFGQAGAEEAIQGRGAMGWAEARVGGSDDMMAAMSVAWVSPWNGRLPEAAS